MSLLHNGKEEDMSKEEFIGITGETPEDMGIDLDEFEDEEEEV